MTPYMNTARQQNTYSHGNFLAHALKNKEIAHVLQIGLRTFDFLNDYSLSIRDNRVQYISSFEVKSNSLSIEIPKDLPYYLTFDVDVFSPSVLKSTGTPVVGGLDYYDGLSIINHLTSNYNIVALDFVELSSANYSNTSGEIVSRYILNAILNKLPFNCIK